MAKDFTKVHRRWLHINFPELNRTQNPSMVALKQWLRQAHEWSIKDTLERCHFVHDHMTLNPSDTLVVALDKWALQRKLPVLVAGRVYDSSDWALEWQSSELTEYSDPELTVRLSTKKHWYRVEVHARTLDGKHSIYWEAHIREPQKRFWQKVDHNLVYQPINEPFQLLYALIHDIHNRALWEQYFSIVKEGEMARQFFRTIPAEHVSALTDILTTVSSEWYDKSAFIVALSRTDTTFEETILRNLLGFKNFVWGDQCFRPLIINRPELDVHHLAETLTSVSDWEVLLQRPDITKVDFFTLFKQGNVKKRVKLIHQLINNPAVPIEEIDGFMDLCVKHKSVSVRQLLAAREGLSASVLGQLVLDPEPSVRKNVLRNSGVTDRIRVLATIQDT